MEQKAERVLQILNDVKPLNREKKEKLETIRLSLMERNKPLICNGKKFELVRGKKKKSLSVKFLKAFLQQHLENKEVGDEIINLLKAELDSSATETLRVKITDA